ncbi:MAG: tryptophan synthase subunit alpha [Proteobacteria bacterium]|nr:tryptophan synthase subunit alpha [Pseudomonadota bacterium]
MNRIDKTLAELNKSNKKMLSSYITAGDPNKNLTLPLMHALVEEGVDILEIGIPFSDPMAEGPVIQAAMERALLQGVNTDDVFAIIDEFRKTNQRTPIILMGYVNPVEQYGYEAFAKKAVSVGVDGTIIVDLPPEESEWISSIWQKNNLYSIYLCSPTTESSRMDKINKQAKGYLYFVSLKGVTGSSAFDLATVKANYLERKKQTQLPLMVGFGIKTAEMASQVAQFADGVIVGAALIEAINKAYESTPDTILKAPSLLGEMRKAMDN